MANDSALRHQATELSHSNHVPWMAWTGVAAGLVGAAATVLSAVDTTASQRRADPMIAAAEGFDGAEPTLKLAAALGFLAATFVVIFSMHLRQRLGPNPATVNRLADLAWAGGLLSAACLVVAAVLTASAATLVDDAYRDTTLEVYASITGNLPFAAWMPLGLSMTAVAIAWLTARRIPAWLGIASGLAVIALIAAVGLGLPFASWAIGCAWLVSAGLGTIRTVPMKS